MSETKSIIVYRNPMEQAFWESGALWPIMVGCGITLMIALILHGIIEHTRLVPYRWRTRAMYVNILFSSIIGVSTTIKMIH